MRTGSRIRARTSDLSMQGCYIDTLNPLPIGAAVRVQIHRSEQVLDVLGTVSSRHVGSGMGLVFADMPPAQRDVVTNWLKRSAAADTDFFQQRVSGECAACARWSGSDLRDSLNS